MNRWAVATLVGLTLLARAGAEPPLPQGAVARLGDWRYRHVDGEAAALSPDGRRLALTTPDAVEVWSLRTGRVLYRLGRDEGLRPRARPTSAAPGPTSPPRSRPTTSTSSRWTAPAPSGCGPRPAGGWAALSRCRGGTPAPN